MKTATVRQAQHDLRGPLAWVAEGETIAGCSSAPQTPAQVLVAIPTGQPAREVASGRGDRSGSRENAPRTRLLSVILLFALLSFKAAFGQTPVADLPLTEFFSNNPSSYFVVLITGDGGVKELVQVISVYLQAKGISVVVMNALKYFWSEKKPTIIAADLQRIENFYQKKWNKQAVVYMGYSIGADILPFALNSMTTSGLESVHDVILIAPAQKVTFVISLLDYVHTSDKGADIYPELKKLRTKNKIYCIADDSSDSVGRLDLRHVVDYTILKGGHHFDGDYQTLCTLIGKRLKLE